MNPIKVLLPLPHLNQQKVLDSKARWISVLAGRRFGKSLIAAIICIKRMLAGEQVAYITPQFGLGKTFFNEILKYIPKAIITLDNKSDLHIQLITGGSLRFFSGEALDGMRGRSFNYCIIDEAAFIPDLEDAWNSSIRPTLSDHQGGCLFISTPKGKNFFYALWMRGRNGEPDYESFHFKSIDNPYFKKEEWDAAKNSMPISQFKQEYEAVPGESTSTAIAMDYITSNTIETLSDEPTVVYGIDVARTEDWTVIVGLDMNGNQTYFERFQKPWEYTKERIKQLPQDVLAVMDSTGVGSVLLEELQRECNNLIGFTFTSESKPKLIYQLIKDIEKGNLKYNQTIADELSVFEYAYTSTGHIKFGAQSGFHDDCCIALALANYYKNRAVHIKDWKLY